MASLVTTINVALSALHTATAPVLDLGTALAGGSAQVQQNLALSLASGTAAGQADRMFSDTRTIAASSNDDLDLAGGVTDAFGTTFSFVRIKALVVVAATGNTNNVVLGAGSNPWVTLLNSTGTVTLRPGAWFLYAAGSADATAAVVTATTGDIFRVANSSSGSTVDYNIVIIGASA